MTMLDTLVDGRQSTEAAHLLGDSIDPMELAHTTASHGSSSPNRPIGMFGSRDPFDDQQVAGNSDASGNTEMHRVYKVRWFGLIQLSLLNIMISWGWLTFAAVANTTATYYGTTPSVINWLSISIQYCFVAAAPFTFYTLRRGGPRLAMLIAASLTLIGNWIRYAGTRASPHPSFGVTMLGQVLIGFAQPFVLAAPTAYSNIWFSPQGRVSATAIMSLANPFGGALGQLICPFLATKPSDIPSMTLYVAVISTVICIPTYLVPSKPKTPVSASSSHTTPNVKQTIQMLSRNSSFWLVGIPFAIYVGFFNSISSLLTQIMTPYGFSETEAGIGGALLILVGLVATAITSPIVDRTKAYVVFIKVLVPLIVLCYFVFIWAPGSRSIAVPYVILGILGAASFSLVPVALEFLAEVTFPIGPEATSTIGWAGGQLFGASFILISDALKEDADARPPFTMGKALIFQAVVSAIVMPLPLALGWVGNIHSARLAVDKSQSRGSVRPGEQNYEDDLTHVTTS